MSATITPKLPDTPDATALIMELEEHLAAGYPAESRHGYSVEKLIKQGRVRGSRVRGSCREYLGFKSGQAEVRQRHTQSTE